MNIFRSMDIAATGMSAERFRMDIVANNIANVNTTRTLSGQPYRRQVAVVTSAEAPEFVLPCGLGEDEEVQAPGSGVKVAGVAEAPGDFKYVYDPDNPDAIKEGKWKGYVPMPNVNIIQEMTNLITASRAYEANASIVEASKAMAMKALEIGRS